MIIWGGWAGHDPEECAAVYRRWLHEDGFAVRIETELSAFEDPALGELDLIVPIYTRGTLSREQAEGLGAAIEAGTGLAGHHGGMTDAFRDSALYNFITGGQFVASPGSTEPGEAVRYQVDIARPEDPIVSGIKGFAYASEQCYMHVDPAIEVLATTTFSGEHAPWIAGVVMPVVWKKMHGKGRVFHSTLGHSVKEFDMPEMATILRRGVNWAAREKQD
jgi:type 1 glutamine amidotransferase